MRGQSSAPVQVWQRRARSWYRFGRASSVPAQMRQWVRPAPAQMRQGRAQCRGRAQRCVPDALVVVRRVFSGGVVPAKDLRRNPLRTRCSAAQRSCSPSPKAAGATADETPPKSVGRARSSTHAGRRCGAVRRACEPKSVNVNQPNHVRKSTATSGHIHLHSEPHRNAAGWWNGLRTHARIYVRMYGNAWMYECMHVH